MARQKKDQRTIDEARRRLIKATAIAGGSLAAGTIPYEKPALKSFVGTRFAYAQATGVLEISFDGQLGTQPPGTPDAAAGQDRWEFDVLEPNTQLTIVVTPDANIDPEMYLFDPGPIAVGETNLLTGTPFGFDTVGVGAGESTMVTVSTAGTFTFAIEDQRSPFNQVAGLYSVTISADKPLLPATQVVDEGVESDVTTAQLPEK